MRRFLSTPPSSSGVKFSMPSVVMSSGSGLMALDQVHTWLESADARTEVRPLTPAALSGEYPDKAHGLSLAVIPRDETWWVWVTAGNQRFDWRGERIAAVQCPLGSNTGDHVRLVVGVASSVPPAPPDPPDVAARALKLEAERLINSDGWRKMFSGTPVEHRYAGYIDAAASLNDRVAGPALVRRTQMLNATSVHPSDCHIAP